MSTEQTANFLRQKKGRGKEEDFVEDKKQEKKIFELSKKNYFKAINDIELILEERKKQAEKSLLLNKTENTLNLQNITQILTLNNTYSEALLEFLMLLKNTNQKEYHIQFMWRKLFIYQKHLKCLDDKEPYALKTSKDILKSIILKTKEFQNNENWLKETKLFMEKYFLYNPYSLKRVSKQKEFIYEIDTNKNINTVESSNKELSNKVSNSIDEINESNGIEVNSISVLNSSQSIDINSKVLDNNNDITNNQSKIIIKSQYELCPNNLYDINDEEYAYRYILQELIFYVQSINEPILLKDLLIVINIIINYDNFTLNQVVYTIDQIFCSKSESCLECCLHYILSTMNIENCITPINKVDIRSYNVIREENTFFLQYDHQLQYLLKKFIRQISKTECIQSLLLSILNEDDELVSYLNDSFISYFFEKLSFTPFFNSKNYGNTDEKTIRVNINISKKNELTLIDYTRGDILLHFFKLLVTVLHELYGHFSIRYLYYCFPDYLNNKTEREYQYQDDGGKYIEAELFGHQGLFNLVRVVYILNHNNWNQNYKNFRSQLKKQDTKHINKEDFFQMCQSNSLLQEILTLTNCELKKLVDKIYAYPFRFKLNMDANKDNCFDFDDRVLGYRGNKVY